MPTTNSTLGRSIHGVDDSLEEQLGAGLVDRNAAGPVHAAEAYILRWAGVACHG